MCANIFAAELLRKASTGAGRVGGGLPRPNRLAITWGAAEPLLQS